MNRFAHLQSVLIDLHAPTHPKGQLLQPLPTGETGAYTGISASVTDRPASLLLALTPKAQSLLLRVGLQKASNSEPQSWSAI